MKSGIFEGVCLICLGSIAFSCILIAERLPINNEAKVTGVTIILPNGMEKQVKIENGRLEASGTNVAALRIE